MADEEARAREVLADMQRRLAQGPQVALGVDEGTATPEKVRAAFLALTKKFHPAKFARRSTELQRNANEVFLGIKAAHETLLRSLGASGRNAPRMQSSPIPLSSGDPTKPIRPATPPNAGVRGSTLPLPRAPSSSPTKPGPVAHLTPAQGVRVLPQPQPRPGTPPQRPGTPPQRAPDRQSTPRMAPPSPQPQDPQTTRGTGEWTPLQKTTPAFDERAELQQVLDALANKNWGAAKALLNGLAVRVPASKQYRALLAYTRGREAQGAGRGEDAHMEFQRALQLDPDLQQAKSAMAELLRRR